MYCLHYSFEKQLKHSRIPSRCKAPARKFWFHWQNIKTNLQCSQTYSIYYFEMVKKSLINENRLIVKIISYKWWINDQHNKHLSYRFTYTLYIFSSKTFSTTFSPVFVTLRICFMVIVWYNYIKKRVWSVKTNWES